ncbi:MAG TPA: hypothetical protein ENG42_00725 [Candidatus Aenigmarchaeota archaeon]|nr:hypothetical protein [Candidatus Aenigmarchaeota archaeon]
MKVYIFHGFHPSEYTSKVARLVGDILEDKGYDVEVIRVPFEETGWGALFRDEPIGEIRRRIEGFDYFDDYFKLNPSDEPLYVLDFHAGSDRVFNPHNLPDNDLEFGYLHDKELAKKGGIPYLSWRRDIPEENRDLVAILNNEKLIDGFGIEIPSIFKPVSEGFLTRAKRKFYENGVNIYKILSINELSNKLERYEALLRIRMPMKIGEWFGKLYKAFLEGRLRKDGLSLSEARSLASMFKSYFTYICDKKATEEKYRPEVLAQTIADGVDRLLS